MRRFDVASHVKMGYLSLPLTPADRSIVKTTYSYNVYIAADYNVTKLLDNNTSKVQIFLM